MVLKLSGNNKLELRGNTTDTSTSVSDSFKANASGIMIDTCPKIDAKTVIDTVKEYQKNHNSYKLQYMRMQLPTNDGGATYSCTGTFDTLSGYSVNNTLKLSGYNSNGEVVSKPSIVGTWGITDYVDSAMLDSLSGTNGMFYPTDLTLSSDYRIEWDKIAVQCVDSTKANYNPAAAIILHSKGVGKSYSNTEHFNGSWWVSQEEVSGIHDIKNWFKGITTVKDSSGIVTNTSSESYTLTDFDSLQYFTGLTRIADSAFAGATSLKTVIIPSTVQEIGAAAFNDCSEITSIGNGNMLPSLTNSIGASAFNGCSKVVISSMGNYVTDISDNAFKDCKNVTFSRLSSSLKNISHGAFDGCTGITVSSVPSSVSFIGENAFKDCTGISSMRIEKSDTLATVLSGAFDGGDYPIYLGNADSSCMSMNLVNEAQVNSDWSTFSGRLSSWFRKYYADELAKVTSDYEIQDFVMSDGNSYLDTLFSYETGTRFETDVAFCNESSDDGDVVHGSSTIGLIGKKDVGLTARVSGQTTTITPASANYFDSIAHNYSIDLLKSTIKKDGKTLYNDEKNPTTGDGSKITLFGDSNASFVGQTWMARLTLNEAVESELIPVKSKSGSSVGFYDIKAKHFIEGIGFTSDGVAPYASNGDDTIVTENGDRIILL